MVIEGFLIVFCCLYLRKHRRSKFTDGLQQNKYNNILIQFPAYLCNLYSLNHNHEQGLLLFAAGSMCLTVLP